MTFDWSHYFLESTSPDLMTFPDTAINFTAILPRARGFDTSYWNHGNAGAQKPIDFAQAYAAGYSFWIGRLTRGRELDSWIIEDYQAASKTPLIKCVYHVLFPGEPAGPHIDRLRAGLALLPEPPKAIGLDLERGAEFGAQMVTVCLRRTVDAIREWWTGKLLLYSNDNYLKNYIRDRCGLDIWLADPDNNDDLALYNPVILQSSWVHEIPGVPDPTTDYDEFMGDEAAMRAYFNAETKPEPPEDNLNIKERLQILAEELAEIIADIPDGVPQPPAPPQPPTPPPPAPEPDVDIWLMTVKVDKAKTWCFQVWNDTQSKMVEKRNDAGKPIMQEYFSREGKRIVHPNGAPLTTYKAVTDADGSLDYYELYERFGDRGQRLFVLKGDMQKPY